MSTGTTSKTNSKAEAGHFNLGKRTRTASKGDLIPEAELYHLTELTVPFKISHVKPGNTLYASDTMIILQDGVTSLEIRKAPKFEPKQIPWRNGLVRDIVWSSTLGVFVLLAQKRLFTFDPTSAFSVVPLGMEPKLKIALYSKIKPYDERHSFWRCACSHSTIYISYSGFGSVVDQYTLGASSCEIVKRWAPPITCAPNEGIWCIRYHESANQLAMTVMNATNNHWRIEVRKPKTFARLWNLDLPVEYGDCEVSPFLNNEWLVINACGIRLLQMVHGQITAAVEYERELKNGVIFGKNYFAIRTKNTFEVHHIEASK